MEKGESILKNNSFGGKKMTKSEWKINIENLTASVAKKQGNEVTASLFKRYDATSFENLSPTHYSEVFSELDFINADD